MKTACTNRRPHAKHRRTKTTTQNTININTANTISSTNTNEQNSSFPKLTDSKLATVEAVLTEAVPALVRHFDNPYA